MRIMGKHTKPMKIKVMKSSRGQRSLCYKIKVTGNLLLAFSAVTWFALCVGCVGLNERTAFNSITYPPTRARIEKIEKKTAHRVLIEVDDRRKDKSVWTYPCAMLVSWIPLVPCCPFKFEDILTGSPYQLDNEIQMAAKSHFDCNGLVKGVTKTEEPYDYRMTITINYCAEKGCWTLYGGGIFPLGCWFAIFGAPFKYGSNLIDADVLVCDTGKRTVYQKHFYKNTFYCAGEYYNHNPLMFLGVGLCTILNEVSRDLSDILELRTQ